MLEDGLFEEQNSLKLWTYGYLARASQASARTVSSGSEVSVVAECSSGKD